MLEAIKLVSTILNLEPVKLVSTHVYVGSNKTGLHAIDILA
jgi:hypothetical protein